MCGIGAILMAKCQSSSSSDAKKKEAVVVNMKNKIYRRGPDSFNVVDVVNETNSFDCSIIGSVLHLRGDTRVDQPVVDQGNQNTFCWNGEVFGDYPRVEPGENDTFLVYNSLQTHLHKNVYDCANNSTHGVSIESLGDQILSFFSKVEGPYSFVYYDHSTSTLWWGRDSQGRRSLVYNTNHISNGLIISSTSFQVCNSEISVEDKKMNNNDDMFIEWQDVPTSGIFCAICPQQLTNKKNEHQKNTTDSPSNTINNETTIVLIKEFPWKAAQRVYFNMASRKLISPPDNYVGGELYHTILCNELEKAITRRLPDNSALPKMPSTFSLAKTNNNNNSKETQAIYETNSEIAVLFSGGLDSTVVAALLDKQYHKNKSIDLLNVCFDYPNHLSPDRKTALASYIDLRKQFPHRKWNLILVNVTLDEVLLYQKHLLDLIAPMKSQMDFNIGAALWFAARGIGYLFQPSDDKTEDGTNNTNVGNNSDNLTGNKPQQMPCKSNTRIIFTGVGADEQLGGYGRHRSSFLKHGGWPRLHEELVLDTNRLWLRNHGRDDRCISDHGKEPRYPFLDEHVVRALSKIPLWEITDPRLEKGYGDKLILRHVANSLGLKTCSVLPKRAIQFGSRIAKQSAKRAKRSGGTRNVKGTDVFNVV
jgi:asparagine synthetase B (glutamine-hydrolysing)